MSSAMSVSEAREVLRDRWLFISAELFQRAISTLLELKGGDAWVQDHPEVLMSPVDEVDPKSLGVHQRAEWFVAEHRCLMVYGRHVYLRANHIEELER